MVTAVTACAADAVSVSVQQLFDKPRRYENKLVAVTGYFDASESLLSAKRGDGWDIVLDFTEAQGKILKKQHQLYSGMVHVVGVFEYIDTKPRFIRHLGGPDNRDLYESRVGFRGVWSSQITGIREFAHVR
jgi:hypothetical protein